MPEINLGGSGPTKEINGQNFIEKYRKYMVPGIALAVAVALVGGAWILRNNIRSLGTQAGCYGYNCEPSVSLGGRVTGFRNGAPLSYGILRVVPGSNIELSWTAENVDRCIAENNWTDFTGIYYPPTPQSEAITRSQVFKVNCYKNRRIVASSSLTVELVKRQ